jgi:hypothetical protein
MNITFASSLILYILKVHVLNSVQKTLTERREPGVGRYDPLFARKASYQSILEAALGDRVRKNVYNPITAPYTTECICWSPFGTPEQERSISSLRPSKNAFNSNML